MKRRAVRIIVVIILIASLAIVSVYEYKIKEKSVPPRYAVCFLMGNTKNVKQVDSNVMKKELESSFDNESSYSVIVIDGKPNEVATTGELSYSFRLGDKKSNDQKLFESKLNELITASPKDSEIDILKALELAGGNFDSEENKRIIIYSSGISTAGYLNFADKPDLLLTKPNEIIKMLEGKHAIPNLSGITVVWYGLNHTADKQNELNSFEEYKLECIWNEILEKSGAVPESEEGYFNKKMASEQDAENIVNKNEYPEVKAVDFSDIVTIPEEEFGFKPGTAELVDENITRNTLKPIADDIKNMGYPEFYIIGSTASADTKERCMTLSIDRAEVIKKLLMELDIPDTCLKSYGIGREYIDNGQKWRVNDLDKDGSLIKEKAQSNRKVMFIPVDSKTGEDFIKDYNNFF